MKTKGTNVKHYPSVAALDSFLYIFEMAAILDTYFTRLFPLARDYPKNLGVIRQLGKAL
jgi:hypothetical protein